MDLEDVKKILNSNKSQLAEYKVKELRIFGSYVRGEQKSSSDIDILVKFDRGASLFDLVGLGNYLEEKLRKKIDVVSEGGIRTELREHILKEAVKV